MIPIHAWYLEGGAVKVLVDAGEMRPVRSAEREAAIGGKIDTFEEGRFPNERAALDGSLSSDRMRLILAVVQLGLNRQTDGFHDVRFFDIGACA